jgi:signal transduction histidine kinase
MTPRPELEETPAGSPNLALSAQARRNLIVQAFGVGMVVLTGLVVTPWPAVLAWALTQGAVLAAEDWLLRRSAARPEAAGRLSGLAAPILRIAATTLYALAAYQLIWRGGPAERLFAFALMSVSMVHVLMRYYRSRWVLAVSLSPYLLILGVVAYAQARIALAQHHLLGACVATFAILLFAVQFWSARAQLAGSWSELMAAREAAEERERAADEASRAKSSFLATMSHELRTPLNGVLGMVQALSHEPLAPVQQERVTIIRRCSEALLGILNDLLDLSKIEATGLELASGEFDLEQLAAGVVAAYEPRARKKGLVFAFESAPQARGRFVGDSVRVRRILCSLADNAVKFTETGGVTLSIGYDDGHVMLRVDDTGIGIDEEHLGRLFEGFFQADAGATRRYGGAGLGLAVCQQLAELMSGSVEAASEPGAGSTFVVRLPLERAAVDLYADTPDLADASPGEIRVLAAEDNDTNRLVLKTLLTQAGVALTLVENGEQALQAWQNAAWDLILMDIQMPVMDGVEAARAIREAERRTGRRRTPILAVTANAMTHQLADYGAAGMDGVVPKPIDLVQLLQAMQAALDSPDGEPQFASQAA